VYVQLSSFYELCSGQERLSQFTAGEANAHSPAQASSALAPKIGPLGLVRPPPLSLPPLPTSHGRLAGIEEMRMEGEMLPVWVQGMAYKVAHSAGEVLPVGRMDEWRWGEPSDWMRGGGGGGTTAAYPFPLSQPY
jgi:hypothetical protein